MAKVRVHLFITGRVQGVFFRTSTQEEAQRRKLTGWVKNLHDRRVEAVFEGEEENVKSLIAWCQSGPPHAVVKDVSVTFEEYRGECVDFEVRW
jgi:acylphosphatase